MNLKYRHKITIAVFTIIIIPFSIFFIIFNLKILDEKESYVMEGYRSSLGLIRDNIKQAMDDSQKKLFFINSNWRFISFLEEEEYTNKELVDFNFYISDIFQSIILDKNDLDLSIYSANKNFYGNNNHLRTIENLEEQLDVKKDLVLRLMTDRDGSETWLYRSFQRADNMQSEEGLCIYKPMSNIYGPLALTELRIPVNRLKLRVEDIILPEESIILLEINDAEGRKCVPLKRGATFSDNSVELLSNYSVEKQYKNYITLRESLYDGKAALIYYVKSTKLLQERRVFILQSVFLFLLLAGLILAAVEVVSFFLTRRLKRLMEHIHTDVHVLLESGYINEVRRNEDEFDELDTRFFELFKQIDGYYKRERAYENEKRNIELQLLQERINPHLLYNTLDTIKWVFNEPRLHRVIDSLVRYYRVALSKGEYIITIAQEITLAEEYLTLQKFTYDAKWNFTVSIPDNIKSSRIIKQLLQPVIENAILHGVSRMEEAGKITVEGNLDEESQSIRLAVHDNGSGMEPEKINMILNESYNSSTGGYGLRNVQRRLRVFYGEAYGISIQSSPGKGTSVYITIPNSGSTA